jgi:hypothetical protein
MTANVNANVDLGMVAATYVFATPVLGGQASASLLGLYGANATSFAGSLTGTLTIPGGAFPFSRFDSISSSITGFADLIGLVGYLYQEIGCDSGSGDRVGYFQSRVVGIGPQIGYIFPVGNMQGYLNLKAYGEFAAADRPSGWNVWLTFALSPAAPTPAISSRPRITK